MIGLAALNTLVSLMFLVMYDLPVSDIQHAALLGKSRISSSQVRHSPILDTIRASSNTTAPSGIASAGEIVQASGEAFNLGYNFSVAVSSLAVLSRGNILLDKVSIGGEHRLVPALPGKIDGTPGGLSKHGRFEGTPFREAI